MMDLGVQQIVTPQGDVLVVMPLAHFEWLSAAAEGLTLRMIESVSPEEANELRDVPTDVRLAVGAGCSPLEAWRQHRQLSQSALARLSGVSRFTIMRIEASGAAAGNPRSRRLLAAALDVPVAAI